jgi:hypothetical protein
MTSLTIEKGGKRRPWKLAAADDHHIRMFHAEGKSDADLAYILSRSLSAICRRRKVLGLKRNVKSGAKKGEYKHSEEAKAKIGAAAAKRWQEDDGYRVSTLASLQQGRKASKYNGWHIPTDPEIRRYYFKVRKLFRSKYARAAVAEVMSKEASPAG